MCVLPRGHNSAHAGGGTPSACGDAWHRLGALLAGSQSTDDASILWGCKRRCHALLAVAQWLSQRMLSRQTCLEAAWVAPSVHVGCTTASLPGRSVLSCTVPTVYAADLASLGLLWWAQWTVECQLRRTICVQSPVATIGIFVQSGSINENPYTAGGSRSPSYALDAGPHWLCWLSERLACRTNVTGCRRPRTKGLEYKTDAALLPLPVAPSTQCQIIASIVAGHCACAAVPTHGPRLVQATRIYWRLWPLRGPTRGPTLRLSARFVPYCCCSSRASSQGSVTLCQ